MSQLNDPFVNDDPRWQPYSLPDDAGEFSQPDSTPTTLKSWLRSDECAEEMGQQPAQFGTVRKLVGIVETDQGPELRLQEGNRLRILLGPRSELERLVRAYVRVGFVEGVE